MVNSASFVRLWLDLKPKRVNVGEGKGKGEGKVKFRPRTGHEVAEGE